MPILGKVGGRGEREREKKEGHKKLKPKKQEAVCKGLGKKSMAPVKDEPELI